MWQVATIVKNRLMVSHRGESSGGPCEDPPPHSAPFFRSLPT